MTRFPQLLSLLFFCTYSMLNATEKAVPGAGPEKAPFSVQTTIAPDKAAKPTDAPESPMNKQPAAVKVSLGIQAGVVPNKPEVPLAPVPPTANSSPAAVKVAFGVQTRVETEKPVLQLIPPKTAPTPEPLKVSIGVKSRVINESDTGLPMKTSFQITTKSRDTTTNKPPTQ